MFDASTIWVLIPITALLIPVFGIAAGAFNKWVEVQEKQQSGTSTEELENAVKQIKAELKSHQAGLEQRVANLETIITSQTWDVLLDSSIDASDKRFLTDVSTEVEGLKRDLSDADKAERLAKRIK